MCTPSWMFKSPNDENLFVINEITTWKPICHYQSKSAKCVVPIFSFWMNFMFSWEGVWKSKFALRNVWKKIVTNHGFRNPTNLEKYRKRGHFTWGCFNEFHNQDPFSCVFLRYLNNNAIQTKPDVGGANLWCSDANLWNLRGSILKFGSLSKICKINDSPPTFHVMGTKTEWFFKQIYWRKMGFFNTMCNHVMPMLDLCFSNMIKHVWIMWAA